MKKFFLLMMLFCSFTSIKVFAAITDTVKQAHVIDGTLNEWAADSFTADKETEISYAVDNDAHQLYIALKITNQRTQFRLMRLGMNVFIDIKGKHKEGTSIEFPLKNSPLDAANQGGGGFGGGGRQRAENGESGGRPDPQQMRQQFAARLFAMKIAGFEGQQDEMTLGLNNDNGINVAFSWDEANVMYIEYGIPITSIGTIANLTGKKISLGIRLNAPSNAVTTSSTSLAGVTSSGGTVGARGGVPRSMGGTGGGAQNAQQNAMTEINIWTKYDMKF
jgi:hypothetical protein